MKVSINTLTFVFIVLSIASCGEQWTCQTKDKIMYSISESGKIGGAEKACSCSEIRSFELRTFGTVDEAALKSDFGC